MYRYLILVLACLFSLMGCVPSNSSIEIKKHQLEKKAVEYLEKKYGFTNATIKDTYLHFVRHDPIPVFYVPLPKTGSVAFSKDGKEFYVLCEPIMADNYQAEIIKESIIDNIINPNKITDEYYLDSLELSSSNEGYPQKGKAWLSGYEKKTSLFKMNQKYEGDIYKFLSDNSFNLDIGIMFKADNKSTSKGNEYYVKSEEFIHSLSQWFPDSMSEFTIFVVKNEFFNLPLENIGHYDWVGPSTLYCSVFKNTYSNKYIQYVRRGNEKNDWYPNELDKSKVMISNTKYIDTGISYVTSSNHYRENPKNDYISSKNDSTLLNKLVLENYSMFEKADYRSPYPFGKKVFVYGIVNNQEYSIHSRKSLKTSEGEDRLDRLSIIVDKSILPEKTLELFLMTKASKGSYWGGSYFDEDDDNFYCDDVFMQSNMDFIIVYRKR